MAEQTPPTNQPVDKITIDPTEGTFAIQFPDGATDEEKRATFLELEKGRLLGKPVEISNKLKFVPLFKPKEQAQPVTPTAPPVPAPAPVAPVVIQPTPVPPTPVAPVPPVAPTQPATPPAPTEPPKQ